MTNAKAYLNKSMDFRLATLLKTLLDRDRNMKVTETTSIEGTLDIF